MYFSRSSCGFLLQKPHSTFAWLGVKSWIPIHYATSPTPSFSFLNQSPLPLLILLSIKRKLTKNLKYSHFFPFKQMEGLIPFVYRAIMQYRNGKEGPLGSWFSESPSASYMRLPGDSGRFQASDIRLFGSDYGFSTSSTSSTVNSSSTQIIVSTGTQSPLCRLTSRRVATWSSWLLSLYMLLQWHARRKLKAWNLICLIW